MLKTQDNILKTKSFEMKCSMRRPYTPAISIKMTTLITITLTVIICFVRYAHANVAIPGPLLIAESVFSVDPLRWIAATMFMCIGIEGAIYHYKSLFVHPYVASTVANFVSLVMGMPLGILGALDPTRVLGPTIMSIWIEVLVLRRFKPRPESQGGPCDFKKSITRPVVGANILTNLILLAYWAISIAKTM